jgi:3-dehydroquinate synthase
MIVERRLGYPIVIAFDVRKHVASALRASGRRVVVLCDANPHVFAIARDLAIGWGTKLLEFPLGERRKTPATLERIWDALAAAGAERDSMILGVGGGVAADLFGFAAATYMRGIPYVHVATTLVAMADAAIGGKTAANLRAGKNLAGAFHDPAGVYVHVAALRTLPFRQVREGLAEIVKTSVIDGPASFAALEKIANAPFSEWPWERVIAQAVRLKAAIVARDRTERGERELLNLGHTFAHGFERASNFRITHGAAVALGLCAAGRLSMLVGGLSERERRRLEALLSQLGMPVRTSLDPASVLEAMQYDKKRRSGTLRFVLPKKIGKVEFGIEAPQRIVMDVLGTLRGTW